MNSKLLVVIGVILLVISIAGSSIPTGTLLGVNVYIHDLAAACNSGIGQMAKIFGTASFEEACFGASLISGLIVVAGIVGIVLIIVGFIKRRSSRNV